MIWDYLGVTCDRTEFNDPFVDLAARIFTLYNILSQSLTVFKGPCYELGVTVLYSPVVALVYCDLLYRIETYLRIS